MCIHRATVSLQVEASDKDAALEKEKEAAEQESAAAASTEEQPASLKKAQSARDKQEDVGTSGERTLVQVSRVAWLSCPCFAVLL